VLSRLVIVLGAVLGMFVLPAMVGQAAGSVCNDAPPAFNANDFKDRTGQPFPVTNTYFPLPPGATFEYDGSQQEVVQVTATRREFTIDGATVSALQVQDDVYENGVHIDHTLDWFAQDTQGNVWSVGEETEALLTHDTAGTWHAGVNGARPGYIMRAHPRPGESYLQEDAPADGAMDFASVVSTSEALTVAAGTFSNVLHTRDGSCLDGGFENKYYARSVGLVLTLKDRKTRLELVRVTRR
jgi:hypothetical protein